MYGIWVKICMNYHGVVWGSEGNNIEIERSDDPECLTVISPVWEGTASGLSTTLLST